MLGTKKDKNRFSYYISNLGDLGDLIMPTNDNNTNWHLFVIQTKKRDGLMHYLEKNGIHTGIHYPVPFTSLLL